VERKLRCSHNKALSGASTVSQEKRSYNKKRWLAAQIAIF
jgi:hypothetical protein